MDMLRSNSKSLGNHIVSPEEEKERLQWEGCAEKEGFKSEWKREWVGKLQRFRIRRLDFVVGELTLIHDLLFLSISTIESGVS